MKSVIALPESDYEKLTIVDPHLKRETAGGKLSILDVKVHTRSGKVIDIEIQVSSDIPEMRERIVYYAARMITEQIGKGEDYLAIKKVISILITDFVLINENSAYHNRYTLRDPGTGSEFSDILEVDVLELPKLSSDGDGTELSDWMRFLKSKSEEELTMLAQRSAPLNKAVGVLMELSADEQTRLLYEAHEKARRDEMARMRGARAEERLSIAKNLLNMELPIEKIAEATGLTREEIQNL